MDLRYEYGGRELTDEERKLLEEEEPRIRYELRARFGGVRCPDPACPHHGQGVHEAVVDVSGFPTVDFHFADRCCEAMERSLADAARAR